MSSPTSDGTASGRFFARHGRKLAQAMTSPSTILLAGAAAAGAILLGAPALLIGAATAGVYAVKVAASTFTGKEIAGRLRPDVDVGRLRDPYRGWVLHGQQAKAQFNDALKTAPAGPLEERLRAMGGNIDEVLDGLARVAKRAQGIDDYLSQPATRTVEQRLDEAQARATATSDPTVLPERQKTVVALEKQASVAKHMRETYDLAVSRMESTINSLDQMTAQLMEVLLTAEDASAVAEGTTVDDLVAQLESVQTAVAELDPERATLSPAELEVQGAIRTGATAPPVATTRQAEGQAQ